MGKSELKSLLETTHQGTDQDSLIEMIQQFLACSKHLQRAISTVAEHYSITDSQFLILSACFKTSHHGISQMQIANLLAISTGQVSNLVEQLRKRELLESVRCSDDRRKQLWKTTAAGELLFQQAFRDIQRWADEMNLFEQTEMIQNFIAQLQNLQNQISSSAPTLRIHRSTDSNSSQNLN